MIKCHLFPEKEFATKEELFYELKTNEKRLIELKQSQVYKGCEKDSTGSFIHIADSTVKGIDGAKEDCIYPIISTTKFYDSHGDVHFDGCFGKTVKDQQGKVNYALDHELKYDSIIAWKEDVRMFVQKVDWSLVNKSYLGQTEALIFEIPKDKFKRKDVLEAITANASKFENSIRMMYVKTKLGINSTEKYYADNKAYYDAMINQIANKEEVEKQGYFFGVEELKIWKEGSLVVAGGSNSATAIYHKEEPSEDTQKEDSRENTITKEDFKELLSKIKV